MKKTLSIIIAIVLTVTSFNMFAFADKSNELTAKELNELLCNMIDKSDGAQTSSQGYNFPTNRLIVKTSSNEKLKENYGAIDSVEGYKGIHIFQYDTIKATQDAYQNFLKDNIEYVEHDFYFELAENSTNENEEISHPLSWNTAVCCVDPAIELIKDNNIECEKVVVAIIDSGIYVEHEYFSDDRIFDGGFARVDDETGESFPSLEDDLGHGTHVAGIIYDNTMSNVELWSYRAFPLWISAPYSVIWSAFELAIFNGADVVNMSLAGPESDEVDKKGKRYCETLMASIEDATNNGVIVVAAAGNECGNADNNLPANGPSVITVAATDKRNLPDVSYSASGDCVDIAAPGTSINSTVPRMWNRWEHDVDKGHIYNPIPSSQYKNDSGTSMATPLVSAAAAMLKSIVPDITPEEFKRIIKETAYIPNNWEEGCYDKNYGTGIVNFYNMVKAVLDPEYSTIPTIEINSDNKFEITAPEGTDSRIYYTLNGTIPTIDNHLTYTEPLNLCYKYATKITAVCHENGKFIGEPVVYDMITYDTKTIFCKWSYTLNDENEHENARWISRNPDIVTVDDSGKITGVSKGTTKVSCVLPTGERIIWKVNVKYSPLQAFFVLFFFGFLWI